MIYYYPVAINLKSKQAVVIGGGSVAERKALGLLKAGAVVRLVSPTATRKLQRLAKAKRLIWYRGKAQKRHISKAQIIIAATDDPVLNKNISQWASKGNILVNVVDRPASSNFISLAVFRKSKAIVAVYTDGKNPVLSRDLKNFLKENWNVFLSYRNRL